MPGDGSKDRKRCNDAVKMVELSSIEKAHLKATLMISEQTAPGHRVRGPRKAAPFYWCDDCSKTWSDGPHPLIHIDDEVEPEPVWSDW